MTRTPRNHRCCTCGHVGAWSESWSWYGSHRDEDAGTIAKFCSPKCVQMGEQLEDTMRRIRREGAQQ